MERGSTSIMSHFLSELREKNLQRQEEWPSDVEVDMLFRAVELGGECGELLGAVKKLYRGLNNIKGNGGDIDRYIENAREEIGDVLICLDLLAIRLEKDLGMSFDIEECTHDKFNKTSRKMGLSTMIVPYRRTGV